MAIVIKQHQENLARIKENISKSHLYFKENSRRYHEYRKYCYKTTVNEQQKALLHRQHKPVVEFNIVESYVSRLLGEFAKHEPSIEVMPAEGVPVGHEVLELVEGHIRHILYQANKSNFAYEVYKDLLTGGFSVAKVWTDYASPMSMEQNIKLRRAFDVTMCGFDPMARNAPKDDGNWSFEIYPMTLQDFHQQYPDVNVSQISYTKEIEGFNWSYKDAKEQKTVLVADYYEKKKKRVKIMKLANGKVITEKNYKKLQAYWEQEQLIEQFPIVVGKPRWTELETVCRYTLIESQIIEREETDYTYLPHVFFDGNSVVLTQDNSNTTYLMTRPYIYNAKGAQDLKNFAGQSWANYLENLIQHKFIVKKEAIPQEEDYLKALTNIQQASTVVVNAYSENNPDKPIPEPIREVINAPAPPEIMNAFQMTEATTQTILGSYASNLGKNDNDLSGKAVIESASVGNSAAMPYVVGYLQSLAHVANIIVDLMPKYLVGQRTIPIVNLKGEKEYKEINREGRPYLDYEERAIHVNIEPGVNFQVQKNQALTQIIALMGVSEEFNKFMNSPQGLPILVKNLTVHGADELEEAIPEWLQQQQQQQQQQMQMAQQMAMQQPQMIRAQAEMQKIQHQAEQDQIENQFEIARLAIDKELADAEILTAQSKVTQSQIDSAVRLEEAQTSEVNHALETAAKLAEIKDREHAREMDHHNSIRESVKLHHEIKNKQQPTKDGKK
jgi:hypothetical protein